MWIYSEWYENYFRIHKTVENWLQNWIYLELYENYLKTHRIVENRWASHFSCHKDDFLGYKNYLKIKKIS